MFVLTMQHGSSEEGVCTTDGGCQVALDAASEEKSKSLSANFAVLYTELGVLMPMRGKNTCYHDIGLMMMGQCSQCFLFDR